MVIETYKYFNVNNVRDIGWINTTTQYRNRNTLDSTSDHHHKRAEKIHSTVESTAAAQKLSA